MNFAVGTVITPTDTWTYTYDAFGNRIATDHNGTATEYVIDPIGLGNLAAEYDAAGNLIARYDHGYGLLSRTDMADVPAYYTFNANGSTSEMTDDLGGIQNDYTYDAFGAVLSGSEAVPNSFQYVGEYGVMNEDNGLEFMRARFYDDNMGRFLSEDPLLSPYATNPYAYGGNSPENFVDPHGLRKTVIVHIWPTTLKESGHAAIEVDGHLLSKYGTGFLMMESLYLSRDLGEITIPFSVSDAAAEKMIKEIKRLKKEGAWFDVLLNNCVDDVQRVLEAGGLPNWNVFYPSQLEQRLRAKLRSLPETAATSAGEGNSQTVRAVDPNDKIAPAGYGEAHFIQQDDLLAYKIRFENQADATAPAHIITITDTLDEDLDLSTFELTEIGFANRVVVVPSGLKNYETTMDLTVDNEYVTGAEVHVQISATLDAATRELTFNMTGLDPQTGWLPEDIMAGILYPNDDTGRGDGYISYLVKPLPDLSTGTEITNKASIIFDWNDPIETPLVRNTIDAIGPADSSVVPLPAETATAAFPVEWSGGEDDPGGSGFSHYDVFVSDNGGDFVPWLQDTDATLAIYIGQSGHTYAFYSVATDNVGHEEPVPEQPDAQTTLTETAAATVLGRDVFYNNSTYDTATDEEPELCDDTAIATDKAARLPGEAATLTNYTSYDKGINGLIIDIAGLPGTPTADDFTFKIGNDNDPANWEPVTTLPEIAVRAGEGGNNSDRITLTWPDNTIQNTWLQVTVLPTANTGLAQPDVFYFGNAIGETGNSTTEARVNAIDTLLARNNPRTLTDPAPIDFPYDFNRDARVNATDMLIARNNQTHSLNALRLITVPDGKTAVRLDVDAAFAEEADGALHWFYELEDMATERRAPDEGLKDAVDLLLAGV